MRKDFSKYRENIIGENYTIETPYHQAIKITYADWTASGRAYRPIEERLQKQIYPLIANTHTDTNATGLAMTYAYQQAQKIIKKHVGASENDVLISANAGMTGVVNKFQRILGLKLHEAFQGQVQIAEADRPIVLVTHMEHHSNHTSWLETIADVEIVRPDQEGLVSVDNFRKALKKYEHRKIKIAAITSCSNVTGIITPFLDIAQVMHDKGGWCFVDFATSAPYVNVNMHEDDNHGRYLDAIYFSMHKFLGGPGATGILLFNKELYKNAVPDHSGGGTVDWTNPWGEHKYVDDIEAKEDGGTPAFLQTIKAAMCLQLKDEMGVEAMTARKNRLVKKVWTVLDKIPNLKVLASAHRNRLGIFSFYIDGLHHHVAVKLLNDRFGIQTRGGCSCAGTYGHYLLNVDKWYSQVITNQINQGDYSAKPGWVRMSIHVTHSDEDIDYMLEAIRQVAMNFKTWEKDYHVDLSSGYIRAIHQDCSVLMEQNIDQLFEEKLA